MTDKKIEKRRSFWSNVERVAERMEFVTRLILGGVFVVILCPIAYGLGSWIWVGIGWALALGSVPFGFLLGFFWAEVKTLLKLALGIWFH